MKRNAEYVGGRDYVLVWMGISVWVCLISSFVSSSTTYPQRLLGWAAGWARTRQTYFNLCTNGVECMLIDRRDIEGGR